MWREEYFDGDRLTTVSYDTFAAQHNVQVLGFAPSEMSHESHLSSVGQSLERSWLQPTLAWDNPVQAWYMPHLSKKFEDGSAVVLCHKGQVSHVGRIIALAEKIN